MLIYIAILLPLIGGALIPLMRFQSRKPREAYVLAVTALNSLIVLWLLTHRTDAVYPVYSILPGMTIAFRIDGMSCVFMGLVAFLWPPASLYGFEYMEHEERQNTFFTWYTMTYGITLALAMSANLFTFYIFYECLTLVTLPLVVHKQNPASNNAGRKYLTFSITGAAMGFVAMIFISVYGTSTDFMLGGVLADSAAAVGMENMLRWVFLLAFIGFGTKAAVFPMYAWLPAASVAPTPVTALLHAVAVVNAGAFAVLRVIYYSFGAEFLYGSLPQQIALGMACFTVVFGSAMAVREQHFKRRLAYSTISNLSYMLMGACLMTPAGMTGALAHMVFHSLMKITLFYCAGAVLVYTEKEYVQDLRGFHKRMPFTCAVFTLGAVAMVGIPPLCGFVSKWNLLIAAANSGLGMGMVGVCALIISAVLTAIYLLGVSAAMYFRPLNAEYEEVAGIKCDPDWQMRFTLALLSVCIIALGMYSAPLITFLRGVASGAIF